MSDTIASLSRKMKSAKDLQSVVRTMKAIAASRIAQFENSVLAVGEYHRTVELGLSTYFRENEGAAAGGPAFEPPHEGGKKGGTVTALVFGSDQGLVGQFNELMADFATRALSTQAQTLKVWAVGERVHARLEAAGLPTMARFAVPTSVQGIVPLVSRIQLDSGMHAGEGRDSSFYVFHNRPKPGGLYEPVRQRLLPLDQRWQQRLTQVPWPAPCRPELLPPGRSALVALISEYLFISIFRACAESLASENASRLAAMERADRNIDELSESLLGKFHRLRQDGIDAELFDVISGYNALSA